MRLPLLERATSLGWCRCTAISFTSQVIHPPVDGNQNRTGPILGMVIGALVVLCVFVGARMYTRLFIVKSAGWDDWTVVAALLGTVIGSGLDFVEIHEGSGRHQYYLTDHQFQVFTKYNYAEWIQTFATLMFTKISICLLLLRISPSKRIIRPVWGIVWFLILTNIVLTLLWMFQCNPVAGAWDVGKRTAGSCFSKGQIQRIIIAQALISIVSDFILAGFPIIALYKVQISNRKKIYLCVLMALGLITAACCIVRTVNNWQNYHADQTWVGVNNFMWRSAEVNIGICTACIPTLLPLYRLLCDRKKYIRQSPSDPSAKPIGRLAGIVTKICGKRNDCQQSSLWRSQMRDALSATRRDVRHQSRAASSDRTGRLGNEDVEMIPRSRQVPARNPFSSPIVESSRQRPPPGPSEKRDRPAYEEKEVWVGNSRLDGDYRPQPSMKDTSPSPSSSESQRPSSRPLGIVGGPSRYDMKLKADMLGSASGRVPHEYC